MLRKDFDEFLFSPVGHESDGTPVTLLTVLARPPTAAETVSIVTRLITLLHRAPLRKAASHEALPLPAALKLPKGGNLAIYCLLGLVFVLVAQWVVTSRPAQRPMDTTITVPDP